MSKKVVHVTPSFYPDKGGVQTHVLELVRQLSERGYTQTIITASPRIISKDHQKDFSIASIVHMPRMLLTSKLKVWRWIWSQRSLFRDADVIQVHDVGWWLLPLIVTLNTRKKLFTTFHGWESYPVRWQAKLHRWILSWLSLKTIHIGDWIQEFYWDTPTVVSYGGVSLLDQFAGQETKQLFNSKNEPLRCVFVGRLEEGNCISQYCMLFQLIRQKYPTAQITWVGDGSFRTECEKVGTVTGMVDTVPRYLSMADIAFCNSYLSLWQCLASGALTVSLYQHDLKKRYLETFPLANNLLIAPDAQHAADHLFPLLTRKDSSLQQRKDEQLARVQQFTWSKVADSYEQLWSTA